MDLFENLPKKRETEKRVVYVQVFSERNIILMFIHHYLQELFVTALIECFLVLINYVGDILVLISVCRTRTGTGRYIGPYGHSISFFFFFSNCSLSPKHIQNHGRIPL